MKGALKKRQHGEGIVVGNSKMCSLACADDIVSIANKEEELIATMKRLEHSLDKRKLIFFKEEGGKEKTRTGNGKVKV